MTDDVIGTHVHDAFHTEAGGDGGTGHAVLSGAGFGNDAALAEALGEQGLTNGVIDFVCAGVVQVFAFQPNFRATVFIAEAFGMVKRGRATDIVGKFLAEARPEGGIVLRGGVSVV